MSPEDTVAALGVLCGSGQVTVRHDKEWTEIRADLLPPSCDPAWEERQVLDLSDLFLILTAEEIQ